ncbi:DIA4 [Sanghuangporus vaninii]
MSPTRLLRLRPYYSGPYYLLNRPSSRSSVSSSSEIHFIGQCTQQNQFRLFSTSKSQCKGKQPQVTVSSGLPKPLLDYRGISENVLYKSHNAFNRKASVPVGAVQNVSRLYEEHKQISSTLNAKRHARSTVGDTIRELDGEAKKAALEEAKSLKTEIAVLEEQLSEIDEELYSLALAIPNDTHPDVPLGDIPKTILRLNSDKEIPASPSRDHVLVGRALNLLDLEAAAVITGSSWYYLLNEGAMLEVALANYALSKALARGFKPVTTPDVVKANVAMRCGFQPRDEGDPPVQQMYHLQSATPGQPELVLSGTAEIPLGGLFANRIYKEDELPFKVVGIGRAFRSEAGARGADTRGLYRVHQFTKLELFAVCTQETSGEMMEEMTKLQLDIFGGLGLPLRVLDMPTEELGASAYRKYDIEAWMPGRGDFGEISSTSNCTDYQARRLHIRYRRNAVPEGHLRVAFVHTLNGTAAAIPRLIVALLENGAQFDESGKVVGIKLPSALKAFWPGSSQSCIEWI